jgi:hypothetical protein
LEDFDVSLVNDLQEGKTQSRKRNEKYIKEFKWMKPFSCIISDKNYNQHITKLALNSITRFLSDQNINSNIQLLFSLFVKQQSFLDKIYTESILNDLCLICINSQFEEIDQYITNSILTKILDVIFPLMNFL